MGAFDWASHALNWLDKRYVDPFKKTFTESWSAFADNRKKVGTGILGMFSAPFRDDGDFWGSARMFADSMVGSATSALGGTVGTLFQVPILHEAGWLLDKAYRYGVARPTATHFLYMTNHTREAYRQGAWAPEQLWEHLTDFNNLRKAWNDSEYVTPGQAIVYGSVLSGKALGDMDDAMRWADETDPRTRAGQAKFNSPEASFWLKYASGGADFALNIAADPGHGATALGKFARVRMVSKVADEKYIRAGKVELEPFSNRAQKVRQFALDAASEEELRVAAFPTWAKGAEAAHILRTAAKMGDDAVWNAAWIAMRTFDEKAFRQLADSAPVIAADFADMYASKTIADVDYQQGWLHNAKAADPLVKTKVEAFVDSFSGREGMWGQMQGIGFREPMPRIGMFAKLKAGYHDKILYAAPVVVARALQNLMPSQGYTKLINAADNTAMGVREIKGNLERLNTMGRHALNGDRDILMPQERVNEIISKYGRAQSDASRVKIAEEADNEGVIATFARWGVDKADIPRVMAELNRSRHGSRVLGGFQRVTISGELKKAADRARKKGAEERARELERMAVEHEATARDGLAVDNYFAVHGADASLNLLPLDPKKPVMRSQFGEAIMMTDFRQLNGHLRWWRMMHPEPRRVADPEAPGGFRDEVPLWKIGLAQAAKAKGFYEHVVGAADVTMMLWKASVLGRLGQGPRGVASDWLHIHNNWGKLALLQSAAMIVPNTLRNFGPRRKLLWETGREWLAEQRAGGRKPVATADVDGPVVEGNLSQYEHKGYPSYSHMFADGAIDEADFFKAITKTHRGKRGLKNPKNAKFNERMLWIQRKEELDAKTKPAHLVELNFRRNMKWLALKQADKTAFARDEWGDDIVKLLLGTHFNRQMLPGYEGNTYAPARVIVDPFMGTIPKIVDETPNAKLQDVFDITSSGTLGTKMLMGPHAKDIPVQQLIDIPIIHEQLKRWVLDNAGELLRPDTHLALEIRPNGHIGIGTARAKREVAESGKVTKLNSAKLRLRNYHRTDIADMSHQGHPIMGRDGKELMRMEAVFGGDKGQALQTMVSARDNPSSAAGNVMEDWFVARQVKASQSWRSVEPTEIEHSAAWERVVNAQVAGDPVMRAFLERQPDGSYRSPQQVETMVNSTAWGTKWIHAMGFRGGGYVNQINELYAIVNELLPLPDGQLVPEGRWELAHQMRADALSHQARYNQMEGLFHMPDNPAWRENMPAVHGAQLEFMTGKGAMFKWFAKFLRGLSKLTSDMPADKWARFPAMAQIYRKHTSEALRLANDHFGDGPIPAGVVEHVRDMGREKAYHDVRYRLYDTATRNDFAYATRLFFPFSAAMMDSYIKYGRSVRENPMLLAAGAYYWDTFAREEMVQDENGYVLRIEAGGERVWYAVDPKTGEKTRVPKEKVGKQEYIQFQLPAPLSKIVGKKFYGVDAHPVFAINKSNLNVFLNLPSGGPLVAFPANQFALSNPEFGESNIGKWLLPYGPTAQGARVWLPPTLRSTWDAFNAENGSAAEANAKAIFQAELTAYGLGTRNEPPTFEEAREKAAGLLWLRAATTWLSPASFQVQTPYKPYLDAYHQLRSNPEVVNPDEEFMKRYGDEFYAMTMTVTRNNVGLSATLESSKAYDKYRDLIAQFPDFGGLIVGSEGAGAFAKSVYEQQKETPVGPGDHRTLREITSISDSVSDLNKRTVWAKYSQMMDLIEAAMVDRGLTSLRGRGARDLLQAKEDFVKANQFWLDPNSGQQMLSPWYVDYRNSDAGNAEFKLSALRTIASDPKLSKREDMRGLLEYFEMRDSMQEEMARRGFSSLASVQARRLQAKWMDQVHQLVEGNLAFAAVWNRWLSNDDALNMPAYSPGR